MENGSMTVRQVIEITISNLNGISVPRWLNEQIGIPIDNAVHNLRCVLDALDRDEKSRLEEQEQMKKELAELGGDGDADASES